MKKIFIITCLIFLVGCSFEEERPHHNPILKEREQKEKDSESSQDEFSQSEKKEHPRVLEGQIENSRGQEKNVGNDLKSFQKENSKLKQNFDINQKIDLKIIPEFQNKKIEIPNFMFHYIEDVPKNTKDKLRYSLSYSPKNFEKLLKYLDENQIETLTFWDLKDILEGKKELPKKSVILGFDDGHLDHYTRAFPLLKKYNKKGVFFVVSSFPENDKNYMNWKQILEMQKNGQEIGGHSFSHPNLTIINKNLLEKEILESKKEIEEKIGKKVISFAYPIGKYNNLVLEFTKKEYLFARTTKFGDFVDTKNLFTIPTIRINPETSIKSLEKYFNKK